MPSKPIGASGGFDPSTLNSLKRKKEISGGRPCSDPILVHVHALYSILFLNSLLPVSASVSATASQTIKAPVNEAIYRRIGYPNLWRNFFSGFSTNGWECYNNWFKNKKGEVCISNLGLHNARTYTSILDVWNNMFEEGLTTLKFFLVTELRLPKLGFLMKGSFLPSVKSAGAQLKILSTMICWIVI